MRMYKKLNVLSAACTHPFLGARRCVELSLEKYNANGNRNKQSRWVNKCVCECKETPKYTYAYSYYTKHTHMYMYVGASFKTEICEGRRLVYLGGSFEFCFLEICYINYEEGDR